MTRQPEGSEVLQGTVVEALANAHFRVQFDKPSSNLPAIEGEEKPIVICYLAGKMRLHRIRIIVGDKVELLVDSYGGKPRIIRRL
ncbi:translation initiation factor IF-1 [Candidatus Campbellbacteria bacterium]|nr:MAG: translation initiation factor IF-1 [Candidatus Campbellbacteria bacterium]